MEEEESYWKQVMGKHQTRREMLRKMGLAGIGLAGVSLINYGVRQPAETLTMALAAETTPAASGKVKPKGKITYTMSTDVGTNDPMVLTGGIDTLYYLAMYESLAARDLDGKLQPSLATSWKITDKGMTLEFTIRKGVKWHNGDPLTAEDVKFTFDRTKLPLAAKGGYQTLLKAIGEVQLAGEDKVVIRLKTPDGLMLNRAGVVMILPKKYIEKVGDDGFEKAPIGTGPYKFVKRVKAEFMELEAFEDWWGPQPWDSTFTQVKNVTLKHVPEHETRISMLKTGEADIIEGVLPKSAKDLEGIQGVKVLKEFPAQVIPIIFATFPETVPGTNIPNPFRDKKVRQALYMAVDRKAIITGIMRGLASELKGPWAKPIIGTDESAITPYPFDPKKAKQMLEQAKFPFDREWPVFAYTSSPGAPEAVEAAAGYWQQIGVKAKYTKMEVGTLMEKWQKHTEIYPFQFIRFQFPDFDPANVAYYAWRCGGWLSQMCDPELDKLMNEAEAAFEPEERDKVWKKVYLRFHEEALMLPLYNDVLIYGMGKRVNWKVPKGHIEPYGLERVTWSPGNP